MNPRLAVVLAAACLASLSLTGCFGGAAPQGPAPEVLKPEEITREAERRFEELTQVVPSNFTFPGQEALEPVVVWLNDTVGVEANAAIESPQDDGGMNFQTILKTIDVSQYVPVGQPAEVHIVLYWYGNPGQSVDLDIFTNLPGARGAYDPGTGQEMNWNIPVKRRVVSTVGVEGADHLIGVQATNGRLLPGQSVNFFLQLSFDYTKDVLTPHIPWAFTLPQGATGVVLRSVKLTGDEHLQSNFVILDPQDNLVTFQEYDDIAIPTESVFIPLRQPGEYVFYAYFMTGGFLSLRADAPVPTQREARPLPRTLESAVDFTNAAAPGIAQHNININTGNGLPIDGTDVETPYQAGASASTFTVEKAHPLAIWGTFEGGQTVAGDAEVRIIGEKGIVYRAVRSLRADLGDQGSLGWSGDAPPFMFRDYSLLGKGSYTVEVVVDGYTGQIGHTVMTYDRGTAAGGA